jgi:gamma-D-glutamyl-L-lysine dipeptidyl-peptidase
MYYYIKEPAAFMYQQPQARSELVSQALFSEQVLLLEEKEGWKKIFTQVDQYPGWVRAEALCSCQVPFSESTSCVMVNRLAAHLYDQPQIIYGPALTLPYESRLQVEDLFEEEQGCWVKVRLPTGECKFIQRGDLLFQTSPVKRSELGALSRQFLGLPYTWGGRSSFGYDCSGFVQMLYRRMGVFLPRDSKDQCRSVHLSPISLDQIEAGDLLFFGHLADNHADNHADKICHVALYLGEQQFIHTSTVAAHAPYVRINSLHEQAWKGGAGSHFAYLTARTLAKNGGEHG